MRAWIVKFIAFFTFCWIGLLAVPVLSGQSAYAAGQECVEFYTVKRGDWLADIARRKHIPVARLFRLNPTLHRNPSLIFPGQKLCIKTGLDYSYENTPAASLFSSGIAEAGHSPALSEKTDQSTVVAQADYTYLPDPDIEGIQITRSGRISKRLDFPIQAAEDAVIDFSLPNEVAAAVPLTPAPVLIGLRNEDGDSTYSLITVSPQVNLASLRVSETEGLANTPGCDPMLIKDVLGGQDIDQVELTVWFEGADGLSLPYEVSKIGQATAGSLQGSCIDPDKVAFVLLPASSGDAGVYRVVLLMENGIVGPPGNPRAARCTAWASASGWFYRWMRSWYGC